jgi:GNAT superfamily N-acetyltransferase
MTSSTVNDGGAAFSYSIIHVPHDEAGIRKYIDDYKAFRLLSLQLAPEAFSSTYAREIAFDDDTWYGRLANPLANTFIAITDTGKIVSAVTMVGPLPLGPELLPPTGNPWIAIKEASGQGEKHSSHFRLNAVFTLPKARRRGISKTLTKQSMEYAEREARAQGESDIVLSTVVEATNQSAKALYEAVGFIENKEFTATESGIGRPVELLVFKPAEAS